MADNPMQGIYLDKVVVNIGIGDNENLFQNAKLLLEKLTGRKPVAARSRTRQPELKLRKGQIIGAFVTLRDDDARDMLKRALDANDNIVSERGIAGNSFSFGVKEYIYFPGVKYDPKIGMLGLNVNAAFRRKGKRVETRKRKRSKVAATHREIPNTAIMGYLKDNFKVSTGNAAEA
ncbi:MAG: 50S ribosomal protein L5 [Candidatus Micrarchaeota archaeon]|nr:50S ribosomal protein L5 [Candidatus Micrarchaeota archaeon]MDE1849629.1 50S ribosomal protein L5 [Candidatus Micrarchaeota archaeon]